MRDRGGTVKGQSLDCPSIFGKMKLSINKLPKCQVEVEIEVPAEDFDGFFEKAVLELGKDLEIKGFRKGKIPRNMLEREVGQEKILVEAANLAIEENYRKAIRRLADENKIEIISRPEIKIQKLVKGEPLVFLAKFSVLPDIELPDYKKIAKETERKNVSVEEKEIEDALKWLQKSRAKFTLKNQPAQKGDFVEVEYSSLQIKGLEPDKKTKDAFVLGEGHFFPGFEENLAGMDINKEKEFSLDVPENHQLRKYGEKIDFKVRMKSVQNMELPEINDQFAKSLGKFEKLEDLKKNIKQGLVSEKEQTESQRLKEEILEKISDKTECDLPDILVKREQKQILDNLKKNVSERLKISFSDYLKELKKNEEELLGSFLPRAEKNIKKLLVLREIGNKEKIEVLENEVSERIEKILKQYASPEEAQKNLGIDPQELESYTKEAIRNEKIFQLLENLTLHNI